jgi:hypothetical protein
MVRQALIAASANALINGGKAWARFKGETGLALTVDSIAEGSGTVLGAAVGGAFGLGLAATAMTYFTFRSAARKRSIELQPDLRFWPKYPLLMLENALFLFGVLVVLSVLFHRRFGEVAVSPGAAALVTAGLAFCVTLYTALNTMRAMIANPPVASGLQHTGPNA